MDSLDKEVIMECYNSLPRVVGRYMTEEYCEEAFEAVILLASTAIQTKCIYLQTNPEHTLEQAFDSISDYTLDLLEGEDELEED